MKSANQNKMDGGEAEPSGWKELLAHAQNNLAMEDKDFQKMCTWLAARTPVWMHAPQNCDLDTFARGLAQSLKSKVTLLPIVPEDQYWRGLLGSLAKCNESPDGRHLTVITDVENHSACDTNHVRSVLDLVLEGFTMTIPARISVDFPQFDGAVRKCPSSFNCAILVVGSEKQYPGTHITRNGTIPDRCGYVRLNGQR